MSFFEKYIAKELDFSEEIDNIETLLLKPDDDYYSIYSQIDEDFLLCDKNLRRTAISLEDFKNKTGIQYIINKIKGRYIISFDEFIEYIEFVKTLLNEFNCLTAEYRFNLKYVKAINENIETILDKINFQIIYIKISGSSYFARCVEKDYKVSQSAELIDNENLAEKIYMYNHHSLKGNIYEKAIILSRLYMHYEKNLKKEIKNINSTLDNEITEISNKLKIRHDKPKSKENIVVGNMTNEELEYWYDQVYALYLRDIILVENLKIKPDLEKLRKRLNEIQI